MKNNYKFFVAILSIFLLNKTDAQTKVTFYTTMGNFEVETYETIQPITAGNFLDLVQEKFYDGIIFHRVVNGFVIQGGDPTGTGSGGPGYTIMDEFHPDASNVQMALGMANSGPNSGGSQFFINLVDNVYLDPDYPVFGIVTSNFDVVEEIGDVAVNFLDKPFTDVVMDSVRVTFDPYVAITELSNSNFHFSISSMPITDESKIMIESEMDQSIHISIYDALGKEVYFIQEKLHTGQTIFNSEQLGLNNLSNGVYFLMIKDSLLKAQSQMILVQ